MERICSLAKARTFPADMLLLLLGAAEGIGSRVLVGRVDSTELAMLADFRLPSDMLDATLGSRLLDEALDAAACNIAAACCCCWCWCCATASLVRALLSSLHVDAAVLDPLAMGVAAVSIDAPEAPRAWLSAADARLEELKVLLGCARTWLVSGWLIP